MPLYQVTADISPERGGQEGQGSTPCYVHLHCCHHRTPMQLPHAPRAWPDAFTRTLYTRRLRGHYTRTFLPTHLPNGDTTPTLQHRAVALHHVFWLTLLRIPCSCHHAPASVAFAALPRTRMHGFITGAHATAPPRVAYRCTRTTMPCAAAPPPRATPHLTHHPTTTTTYHSAQRLTARFALPPCLTLRALPRRDVVPYAAFHHAQRQTPAYVSGCNLSLTPPSGQTRQADWATWRRGRTALAVGSITSPSCLLALSRRDAAQGSTASTFSNGDACSCLLQHLRNRHGSSIAVCENFWHFGMQLPCGTGITCNRHAAYDVTRRCRHVAWAGMIRYPPRCDGVV